MKKHFISFTLISICLFCVLALIGFGFSSSDGKSKTVNINERDSLTFLCAGFDYAGNNTDSLILVSISTNEKSVKFLQIPRDTFVSGESSNKKINNLYSAYYEKTGNSDSAMLQLKETVSDILALPVDYYFFLELSAFSSAVDKIGGIEIDVPYDMEYVDKEQNLDISIKRGKQILDGQKALNFVRYRFGYVEGDLGRVDAQKIFLSAFLNTVKEKINVPTAVSILKDCASCASTDMPTELLVSFAVKAFSEGSQYKAYYMTLPGEGARDGESGLSYYAVNRASAIDMLSEQGFYGFERTGFDASHRLLNDKLLNFSNIYYAPNYGYSVYSDEDIKNIKINLKS